MRFLTLYTPSTPRSGPPSAEQMTAMGAYMQESFKSGVLVATGGMTPGASGARATIAQGRFDVDFGPHESVLQQAGGWAILDVRSREHLTEEVRRFLEIAGDGQSDMIEIMQAPTP